MTNDEMTLNNQMAGDANWGDSGENDAMRDERQQISPKRVVVLDHTALLGGGEIALLNLVKAVDRGRWEIVVVLFADGPLVGKLREAGVEVRVLVLDPAVGEARKDALGAGTLARLGQVWKAVRFVWRLRGLLRELRPAVVHTNSLKSDILGGMAGRLARVPVVWHVRDRIVPEYLPGSVVRVFRRLCRWIPRHVVANSRATLETLCLPEDFTRAQRRARVVHDGVPVWEATGRPEGATGRLRIGLVGRISPWKGQHIFLQAAALVRRRFPEARFVIMGAAMFSEEAYEKQIQALTDKLALRAVVEYTGFCSNVPAALAELDILVHASTIGEPFGQVVAEGMMAGKPVVATNGGGVPEIVIDGESGVLVPMDDAGALAAAVERLAGDAALRASLGAAGRQRVLEHFTVERTAAGVAAVWEYVAAREAGAEA